LDQFFLLLAFLVLLRRLLLNNTGGHFSVARIPQLIKQIMLDCDGLTFELVLSIKVDLWNITLCHHAPDSDGSAIVSVDNHRLTLVKFSEAFCAVE
jgi:hypothetical protein